MHVIEECVPLKLGSLHKLIEQHVLHVFPGYPFLATMFSLNKQENASSSAKENSYSLVRLRPKECLPIRCYN